MKQRFRPTLAQYRQLEESFKEQAHVNHRQAENICILNTKLESEMNETNMLREDIANLHNEAYDYNVRIADLVDAEHAHRNMKVATLFIGIVMGAAGVVAYLVVV